MIGSITALSLLAQEVEVQPRPTRHKIEEPSTPFLRIVSDLVLVPVHVTTRSGVSVTGLDASEFSVLEDQTKQQISSFGNEDVPCSLGVIFDLSGSMSGKLSVASSALHAFLRTASPEDEAFLMTVSSSPRVLSEFTRDFGTLESRLLSTPTGGATALNDTIALALERMRYAQYGRKALLVVSDGMDNHSRATQKKLLRDLQEADVQVYTVGIETWSLTRKPIELAEEREGADFLRELASGSGGLYRTIRDLGQAAKTAEELSRAIRDQYLIGYRPATSAEPGRWRSIRVQVDRARVQVSARAGYYSH